MHKFSAEGPSNIQFEELPDIASLNPPNFEKQEWNISLPKTNNWTDDSTFVEDNFGINMQEFKSVTDGNNGLLEYNMQFPDLRLTPHISFTPTGFTTDMFSPTQLNHPYILPKPHFYPQFHNTEDPTVNVDQFIQTYIDQNGFQPHFAFTSQSNEKGQTKMKNTGRGKNSPGTKMRTKKDKSEANTTKGKRPAKEVLDKDEDSKKTKIDYLLTAEMVNSFPSASAETRSIQSRCMNDSLKLECSWPWGTESIS